MSDPMTKPQTPTDGDALVALALRVEMSSGPDRELDDAIASELFTGKHRVCIKGLSDEAGGMWMFRYPNGSIGSSLRFTGSLDAAMTLIDSEGYWRVGHFAYGDKRLTATVYWYIWPNGKLASPHQRHAEALALSPARALTAASLRAIHARGCADGENDGG